MGAEQQQTTDDVTPRPDKAALDALKRGINADYHVDENTHVDFLLEQVPFDRPGRKHIHDTAVEMVKTVRSNRKRFGGLDSFLQEFGLTTREGIALMCLAEALLRIPDADTADRLIKDKIGGADWDQHIGKGPDLFVNASTWALMLTGKVLGDPTEERDGYSPGEVAGRMVSRLGEPVVRNAMLHAMKILGRQFVMGRTIDEATKRARDSEKNGYRYSYDMLGEAARTMKDAERYFESYASAIKAIGESVKKRKDVSGPIEAPGISVKLSALHPRYSYAQREICVPALTEKLKSLALLCRDYGIGLTVDAEEADRLEISLDIIENVFTDPELGDWEGFGLALQAYQKRAWKTVHWLAALAEGAGRRMMVRLVKGAYWDSEIKHAQVLGLDGYPVFTRKHATDLSFIACASALMKRRDVFYPQFATHNAHTVATVMELAGDDTSGFEFQRLHGMGEPLYHQIVGHEGTDGKYPCRVYAPVGSHEDLLPYLVRRLLENGANSSFVNRIQNDNVPIEDIVSDPVGYMAELDDKPHPKIPMPDGIYGEARKNAKGVELANSDEVLPLLERITEATARRRSASPLIGGRTRTGKADPVLNPANLKEKVGEVTWATAEDIKDALETTAAAFDGWNATPADERAACLEKFADLMEENLAELMEICIREAGKSIPDSVAEIREAVDFCRYYAIKGREYFGDPELLPGPTGERNMLSHHGRGVFLCISPWNFPLAIFTGQVTAALMAGNTVIAKPAEQTPLVAMRAVELMIEAGIPADVIALLPADGPTTGKHLVPDERVAGVAFTGSTETAKLINRTLAEREGAIVPLIAETGGQNAMIVDSSALPEQVVDDVIVSAFHSAGQRCSALRVLYVQDGIADKVIAMLEGAMKELVVGDPMKLRTDIGPVIDEEALSVLEAHAKKMSKSAKLLATAPENDECRNGTFFLPRAFEIGGVSELEREVFGPVLHVVRYKTDDVGEIMDEINSTGYGLTFGVHTRIDYTSYDTVRRAAAGNCYVNRSMTGAVVGVQPFGGQGLSGTGPKAGGPHYLLRFGTEKSVSIDTTASGGNTTLVSLSED